MLNNKTKQHRAENSIPITVCPSVYWQHLGNMSKNKILTKSAKYILQQGTWWSVLSSQILLDYIFQNSSFNLKIVVSHLISLNIDQVQDLFLLF